MLILSLSMTADLIGDHTVFTYRLSSRHLARHSANLIQNHDSAISPASVSLLLRNDDLKFYPFFTPSGHSCVRVRFNVAGRQVIKWSNHSSDPTLPPYQVCS